MAVLAVVVGALEGVLYTLCLLLPTVLAAGSIWMIIAQMVRAKRRARPATEPTQLRSGWGLRSSDADWRNNSERPRGR